MLRVELRQVDAGAGGYKSRPASAAQLNRPEAARRMWRALAHGSPHLNAGAGASRRLKPAR
jgi:hypothetical protein